MRYNSEDRYNINMRSGFLSFVLPFLQSNDEPYGQLPTASSFVNKINETTKEQNYEKNKLDRKPVARA